jgi:peptide/nickel transport system permease protein
MVMALLGGGLGFMMVAALPGESAALTYIMLMALLAALCGLIGYTDYHALRTGMMALLGLCVGSGIAFALLQGTFVVGFMFDRIWHLILPVVCLSYGGFAFLAKLTRSSVLENLLSDYARTARAKGVPEQQVLWRHVFRNSLLPLITVSAGLLPSLLGGSIIVEVLFSIDGMGKLAVEAVQSRDRELVLSITLIGALLSLAGYLLADLCYAIADPRVSYE